MGGVEMNPGHFGGYPPHVQGKQHYHWVGKVPASGVLEISEFLAYCPLQVYLCLFYIDNLRLQKIK